MTSPVDFISGPRITSSPGNLSKGKTDSFTNTEFKYLLKSLKSLSFFKLDLLKIAEKEVIPDSDILNYYQQNQFKFIEPKKIGINYILLNENLCAVASIY